MWTPILDGELADEARRAVRDIADGLATADIAAPQPAETALFWAYAAGAFDDASTNERYETAMVTLVDSLGRVPAGIGLHGGIAGYGWVLAHISDEGGEMLSTIDRALVTAIAAWDGPYDLIGGLAGVGVYFLERITSGDPFPREALGQLVDRLVATASIGDAGTTWHTPARWLSEGRRAMYPDGEHDCGVAHGTPAVIAMLGRIAALPDPPRDVTSLCRDAIRWLAAQQLPPPHDAGRFPFGTTQMQRARTAWCYGDPGIAAAVWSAAARTGLAVEPWRELATAVATRPPQLCLVRDAGLCHGAFGLAHLCNRFFQATGDLVFREAARSWIEGGLAMRAPRGCGGACGPTIGGFRAPDESAPLDARTWSASDALLVGASGIGLALLAALASEEPGWDRLLACDLPTRQG